MQSKIAKNLIFIRLFPGENLYQNLTKVCQKYQIQTAIVLSGLGQLKNFQLGYFKEKGNYCPQKFRQTCELLALTGNISRQQGEYKFHLHAVLAGQDKKAIGGHLISGTVETTAEIVLFKSNLKIFRKVEEISGLEGLFLDDIIKI